MKAFALTAALAVLTPLGCAGPVAAEPLICGPASEMLDQLRSQRGEVMLFVGGVTETQTVILTATPDGSNWTFVVVDEGMKACIGAAGPSWSPGGQQPVGKEG